MTARWVWLALAVGVPAAGIGFGAALDTERWAPGTATVQAPGSGYDRGEFGGWVDTDRDTCDTRDEVLARAALAATVGPDGCVDHVVILDPYTGERVDGRAEIDIDHVVSLRDAWDSGASTWDRATRVRMANDEANLAATSDDVNRAKSDRDASVYRPQSCTAWRWYADVYRATKVRYGLIITPQQQAGLTELRSGCPR